MKKSLVVSRFVSKMNKVFFLIFLSMLCMQCTTSKKFVGQRVIPAKHPHFHIVDSIPNVGEINTEHFLFDFKIIRTKNIDEYLLEGGLTYTAPAASFQYLINSGRGSSRFYIMIVKDNLIIDSILFRPLGQSLSYRLPVKIVFNSTSFDAIGFTYNVVTNGF